MMSAADDVIMEDARRETMTADAIPMSSFDREATIATLDPVPHRQRSKGRLLALFVAIYLTLFLAALDQTITATATPTIAADLHSASGYYWIGGAYLLTTATAGPICSKCSDIWGRKPILLGCVALFAAASLQAALSHQVSVLISARALQGVAGGGVVQLVFVVIADLLSQQGRALAMGLTEVIWAFAGGVGPIVGGALAQYVDWHWCFWINLPVCLVALVLLLIFLDVHSPRTRLAEGLAAIDWLGTVTMTAAVLLLLLPLNFGGVVFPWASPIVICMIIASGVALSLFVVGEKKVARFPITPLSVFRGVSNNAVLLVSFAHGCVFIAAEYYLPLYFQAVRSASPLRSGVLVLPFTLSEAATGLITGIAIHRTGRYREIIIGGMAVLTLGIGLLILLDRSTSIAKVTIYQIIAGAGAGCVFAPPIIAIQSIMQQSDTAAGTATVGLIRNLGLAASIVLGGVVFQNGMDDNAGRLRAAGLSPKELAAFSGSEAAANVLLIRAIDHPSQKAAVETAFAHSLRYLWVMYTCISAVGFVAALFIVQVRLSREHTETQTGIAKLSRRQRDT